MKKFVNIIMVLFLILGLTVGLYLLQQKYSFDLRKKAGGIETSQFMFEGPSEIQVNQPFDVKLILDTNGDPDYTIAGADAKISFSGLTLKQVSYFDPKTQANIFDSYPGYTTFVNETTVSGIKNYSVDENGYFVGFNGQGVFATLTFEASNPGDYDIRLVYNGESATDDSNINGFYKFGPVSIQKPVERLLIQPNSLNVRALGIVIDPLPTPTPSSINHAPEIETSYLPIAYTDSDYLSEVIVHDQDGDKMTINITNLPFGLTQGPCARTEFTTICNIVGKAIANELRNWSIDVQATDSKGTRVSKKLWIYVSDPQPTWVNWYNDSIHINGGLEITMDGKTYKNFNIGASNLTENSLDVYWLEHGYNNSINLKFDHDDNNWWISQINTNIGGKINNSSGATFYVTPLGQSFTISDWQLPYAKFKYFTVQAFTNIDFEPEFLSNELPVGRLFGWYTGVISVKDKNLTDWNEMQIENLPAGLKLGTCVTQYDENIHHCLISGRPVSIGDHKITAKVYARNHDYEIVQDFILPVRLFSSTLPTPPKLIVSKTEHQSVFVKDILSTISVEITNIGGSDAMRPNPQSIFPINIGLSTCNKIDFLAPGDKCLIVYDVVFTKVGNQEFGVELTDGGDTFSTSIPVANKSFTPLKVFIKPNNLSNPGDLISGHVSLLNDNKIVFETDTQFKYQPDTNKFNAEILIPVDLSNFNLTLVIKTQGSLPEKLPDPIKLNTNSETPVDASFWTPVSGDINGDNKINLFDYNEFVAEYGKTSGKMLSDLNYDGKINIFDYNLLVANYGKQVLN